MSVKNVRGFLAMLSLLSLELFVSEVHASGPAVAQQTVVQAQSAITDASLGWHHGGWGGGGVWGGGWHHAGWGWGGGLGWGGWGYRGIGWGGGWGYPAYGYAGYGFVRPVIYTYPAYTYVRYRAPRYCCGYSYTVPTSCCSNNTISTPTTYPYTVAGSTYPAQPVAYTTSYSSPNIAANPTPTSPIYTSGTTYTKLVNSNRSNYGSEVYTPTLSSRTASSTISQPASRSVAASVSATYPPAPVAYARPVVSQQPIAKRATSVLHAEYLAASNRTEVVPAKVAATTKW